MLFALYTLTLAAFGWAAWHGRDYYRLPLVERPHHPLHWQLKPGGETGRVYGIAGASLMTAMLVYSLRKRLPLLRRWASLGAWLDFHIWCGIAGPSLIVLHSALKVNGLIAIAFWSMVAVAASGILGRFLYAQIPRTAAGDQLSLAEARRLEGELVERLRREFSLGEADLARLAPSEESRDAESLLAALARLVSEPWRVRRRLAPLRRQLAGLGRRGEQTVLRLARQRALLHRRLHLWRRLHELFHYWHVFHKPFAILMYLFAAIHIGVAFATGYALGSR